VSLVRASKRTPPSVMLLAVGMLVVAILANEGLRSQRRRLEPARSGAGRTGLPVLPGDEGSGSISRAIAQVSYEFRRIAADVLWFKLDAYVHEGPSTLDGQGRAVSGYFNNLDIVPLYRLITWLDPHFIDAYRLAGTHILNTLDRPDDAERMWEEGVANNRDNPRLRELHGELAVHYMRDRGDHAKARWHLEQALDCVRRYPRYEEQPLDVFHPDTILGLLVVACYRMGDVGAALAYARENHNLVSTHPVIVELSRIAASRREPPIHSWERSAAPPHDPRACGEADHDHGRGRAGAGSVKPPPTGAARPDLHERLWRERARVSRIWAMLALIGLVDAVLVCLRAVSRRCGRVQAVRRPGATGP